MIDFIIIGVLTGCLTIFLNYCIGKPGSKEFSPYEIFSGYSIWLAKRRLKDVGLMEKYEKEYHENLRRSNTKAGMITLKKEFWKLYYDAAEPYFTWERAFGMCPVCNGFWVSLLSALVFSQNIVDLLTVIVISHVVIRILNKIL